MAGVLTFFLPANHQQGERFFTQENWPSFSPRSNKLNVVVETKKHISTCTDINEQE
jgi:undecaprenyl pyrophosphate synthase